MAEDLVLTAISNLISLYNEEVNMFESVNQERKKVESNLSTIKAVLQDAEKKQLSNSSDALKNWLQKLHDAVYEVDDISDDCSIEDIRDEYEGDKSCSFLGFLHPRKVMFRRSISSRMKAIRERLEFIAKEKDQFNFLPPEQQADASHNDMRNWRQTKSFVTEEIFGRKQDQEIIVGHLLEGAEHGDTLFVYPIVGLGGLGKTTIAQLVYHDERVTKHFELKNWICVSDNFDLNTLLKAITGSNGSPDHLDLSIKKLRDMLQGKRYLIVLDDVWNENPDKWMELRSSLDCGAKGSAVVITTRLEKVAMMMRTPSAQPYHLTALPEEDCWQVFRKRAFGSCIVQETQYLVSIGKEIVSKCKGVPLAVKTLGGLLMFTSDERFWTKIRDSELWNLSKEEGSIFASLRLSYLNLSPRARRCFAFCSIFPKDHEISKMDLIHLWMANGLISEGQSTTLEVEDMGEEMVNNLYWRSLIQDIRRNSVSESILYFKMHDLVHDLAQSISSHETEVLEGPSSTDFSPGIRHISINYYGLGNDIICNLSENQSIRSLVFLSCKDDVALAILHSLNHTRLRALVCSDMPYYIPSSIGSLTYLRYLNLSHADIRELPDSIGSLWNLQTLNVSSCGNLETFPVSIGRLKNLRHLCNERCDRLSSMPQSMVGLTSLRTLKLVVMGEPEKKDQLQLSGLEHMKYLRGTLEINYLERVRDVKDVEKANLNEKQDLDNLVLRWRDIFWSEDDKDQQEHVQVLEALRPPPRLRRLELIGYKGIRFSNWMVNEMEIFRCMRSLQLVECKNCKQLPPLWKLPSLKELVLDSLGGMRYLIESQEVSCGEGFVTFPTLEVLEIHSLPVMEKIISGKEINNKNCIMFPRLSELVIKHCPEFNSFNSGAFPSLKNLQLDSLPCMRYLIENNVDSCGEECVSFPSLEELNIKSLPRLENIIFAEKADQKLINKNHIIFPSLKKIELNSLPWMRYLIENNQESCGEVCVYFPLLEVLRILSLPRLEKIVAREEAVDELNKQNYTIFPRLSHLFISTCPKFKSFNSGPLPSLRSLGFFESERIMLSMLASVSYKLQNLEVLFLHISHSGFLESFADQMFQGSCSLQILNYGNCFDFPKLQDLFSVVLQLTSLQKLTLSGFPVKSLDTDILADLPSLRCLDLSDCKNLESLPNWMNQLASLEELTLEWCGRLTTLPDSIRQLSKLKTLVIYSCPELTQRCNKETGQDWHKIAHIPDVHI